MTTNDKPAEVTKLPHKRKGVSDRTLYKYIKLAATRFNLTDKDDTIDELLVRLADSVMDGDG